MEVQWLPGCLAAWLQGGSDSLSQIYRLICTCKAACFSSHAACQGSLAHASVWCKAGIGDMGKYNLLLHNSLD